MRPVGPSAYASSIRTWAAVASLLIGVAAPAPTTAAGMQVVGQTRELQTSAQSDMDFLSAPGFEPFDAMITSSSCQFGMCFWNGAATQISTIDALEIKAKGNASAGQEMGVWCQGCATALSTCEVLFELPGQTQYGLSGQLAASSYFSFPGTASTVVLTGPSGVLFSAQAVPSQIVPVSTSGSLPPGSYSLKVYSTVPGLSFSPLTETASFDVTFTIIECPGDVDADGTVGGADIGLLLAAWGSPGGEADLDESGIVDGEDLGLLLAAWGPCPSG